MDVDVPGCEHLCAAKQQVDLVPEDSLQEEQGLKVGVLLGSPRVVSDVADIAILCKFFLKSMKYLFLKQKKFEMYDFERKTNFGSKGKSFEKIY